MRKIWSEEDLEILRKNWSDANRPQILAKLPNKRWTSIRHKATELKLTKIPTAKYWKTYGQHSQVVLSEHQKAYLAGIIDGEGTIRIVRATGKYYAPFIQITNTSMELMEYLESILGEVGHLYVENPDRRKPNHKTKLVFNIASVKGVKDVLTQIAHLLVIKKKQAQLVLHFIELKEGKKTYGVMAQEQEIFEEVKKLQVRGNGNA